MKEWLFTIQRKLNQKIHFLVVICRAEKFDYLEYISFLFDQYVCTSNIINEAFKIRALNHCLHKYTICVTKKYLYIFLDQYVNGVIAI